MPETQTHKPADDPPQPVGDVEALCAQFSKECSSGRTRIAEWLEKVPEDSRRVAFRKLLATELTQRCEAGETPEPGEYRRQFPDYCGDVDFEFDRLTNSERGESHSATLDRSTQAYMGGASDGGPFRQPGDHVGRYRLERRVGGGGFGVVWQAFDPELNRRVAIKLARPDRSFSESVLQQTREEARKAAAVTHRGIVPVYDVVPCEGSLGIVSEFIPGQTLADRMQAGRVPLGEAVAIVIQVAQALHHAHKHGLVHRDVKPGNILLRPGGDAVLTDFGLAVSEVEMLREPGGAVGTRSYMSPEQARGESNRVDARSDVFSLGVVLYSLVTGRLPWVATTPDEYLEQLLCRNPRPPRTIDEEIDPELERICLRCLEKPVASRYATCDELVRDLTALQAKLGMASPSESRRRKTARWAPAAAVVLMAAAIATAIGWPGSTPDPESPGGKLAAAGAAKRPPPLNPKLPPWEAVEPDPLAWRTLLDEPPTMIYWQQGAGREKPQFDAELQSYSLRSERMRWISSVGETDGRPFEIRAVLHIENWIGHGGIMWGWRDDADALPQKRRRCLVVEFLRTDEGSPAQLAVRELFIAPRTTVSPPITFDEWRLEYDRKIADQEVAIPEKTDVLLKIQVNKEGILASWGDRAEWQPRDVFRKTDWLPAGKTGIGMTGGFSRNTRLADLSLRYLP